MAELIDLTLDDLLLDHDNPRIGSVESQIEALQKIINEQEHRLLNLAADIATNGLSPIDLMYVIEHQEGDEDDPKYVVIEGNRRLAALRLLNNAQLVRRVSMPEPQRKKLLDLGLKFDRKKIEPIVCALAEGEEESKRWIKLRHTGQNEGVGLVPWEALARERFSGDERTSSVYEFALKYGKFSDSELAEITKDFSPTTLGRLIQSPAIRDLLGLSMSEGKISINIQASEVIKPLRRILLDITRGKVDSRNLNTVQKMTDYIAGLPQAAKPDLAKTIAPQLIAEAQIGGAAKSARQPVKKGAAVRSPRDRKSVAPRKVRFVVSETKPNAILYELTRLNASDTPFAAGVLFRVFVELSVDHYCGAHTIPTREARKDGKGHVDYNLAKKVALVVEHLKTAGVPAKELNPVNRAVQVNNRIFSIDRLHDFVHHPTATPSADELKALWDETEKFFERIWT